MRMRLMRAGIAAIVALLTLIGGCVVIPPTDAANRAFANGFYEEAEARYQKSLDAAKSVGNQEMIAVNTYGLARTKVQLCQLSEAESLFIQSIAVRQTIPSGSSRNSISQNHLELARLYLAERRNADANEQIEAALPVLTQSDIESTDPIAYADLLESYATSLRAVNRDEAANNIAGQVERLRRANPYKPARYTPTPFPGNCDASKR